jgi:hydroxyacylglutathione hydrolase
LHFARFVFYTPFVIPTVQLEDELGDVLEKAMQQAGLNETALSAATGVPVGKIRDAIDYRPDFSVEELRRLAVALHLNEIGFCALGCGRYPQPNIAELPFNVWPLRMTHGIGVTNAYVVAEPGSDRGLLFDTGAGIDALERVWPPVVQHLDAVFLTHVEAEHVGGLCEVVKRFGGVPAFVPRLANAPCGRAMGEGEKKKFGTFEVVAFSTPGHAAAHNCYLVRAVVSRAGQALLVSGDLVFAGSAGGGYFCHRQLHANVRRVLDAVPPSTVIAPGHGPLTTAENELRYNPFIA